MKDIKFIYLTLMLVSLSLLTACDDDNSIPAEVLEINKFINGNMNYFYFWNKNMPDINYMKEADSKQYFDKLLFDDVDQWSFITDDVDELNALFSGISRSMGHSIRLFRLAADSNDLIGFIEYVEPGSPADLAGGVYRGRMFHKIDGTQLTISNYSALLNQDEYTITFGVLNQDFSISDETPSVSLTAVEWLSNPILLSTVIEHGGSKVGYLVYTSFVSDYDDELEAVFADFKSQGVDNLVLDLRYNSGGSVGSAILLSSMIAPAASIGDVLLRTSYNTEVTNGLDAAHPDKPDLYIDRLLDNANNLNLNKVAVLSTYKTASASEMVIYGLDPHMEVYHIGEQTHGKYYGSITVSDPDEKHSWAIQPIIMRAENKTNSINYNEGLIPDEERVDFLDASKLYELGDVNEDFLSLALTELTGVAPEKAQLKGVKRLIGEPINIESTLSHPLQYDMQYPLKNKIRK